MSDAKENKYKQLRYIQALDKVEDAQESELEGMVDMWDCKTVLAHRKTRKKGKTFIEVKCVWNDINRSTSWADMNAVALVDPTPIPTVCQEESSDGTRHIQTSSMLLCRGGT